MLKHLGIDHPFFQAPMAGVTTPEFVAACANAGIVGAIGAGYLTEQDTRTFIQKVRKLTARPFLVNLFVPETNVVNESVIQQANVALNPIRQKLGIVEPTIEPPRTYFERQVEVIIEERVSICSFTFGLPPQKVVDLLKSQDVFLIGTVTTTEEARFAQALGMDAVVVQGSEAGGHQGSFYGEKTFLPLEQLVHEVREGVQLPIIAAGGIMNKKSAVYMMELGATAVQLGTALLVADESGAHPLHKQAVLRAKRDDTVLTTAFSGKWARGLKNDFIEQMVGADIAPYPVQNTLTKGIRTASAEQGKSAYMSLWAGENAYLSEDGKAEEIIAKFL